MLEKAIPAPKELHPLPGYTYAGKLNYHFLYADKEGTQYLKRVPLAEPDSETIVAQNKEQWGFSRSGEDIVPRTLEETLAFTKLAHEAGLRVVPAIPDGVGGSLSPFIDDAVTLDQYLPAASDEDAQRTLKELFDDIDKAHSKDIVYGDRYSANILVGPAHGVSHIDFDLGLRGEASKEFDLAQIIFYSVAVDPKRSPATLRPLLRDLLKDYDFERIKECIETKMEKSDGKKYMYLKPTFADLFVKIEQDRAR